MKQQEWLTKWGQLDSLDREFVLTVHPYLLDLDLTKLKSPVRCVKSTWAKLRKNEWIEFDICNRCCGDGHYSFNRTHGTTCFKCEGHRVLVPRLTLKFIEQLKTIVKNSAEIKEFQIKTKNAYKKGE